MAHGIGTSEVEHVLATQTLRQRKAKNMRVWFDGEPAPGVGAKDFALALIGLIGTGGGTGSVIEYAGPAIEALSMEGRMTLCNMTIEAGAKAGLIAPDAKTFEYMRGRPAAPKGAAWEAAMTYWTRPPLRQSGSGILYPPKGAGSRSIAGLAFPLISTCWTPNNPMRTTS